MDITGENYDGQLVNFEIEDNCYVNDKFLGTTVSKKITVNIINPDNDTDLENKEIQAFAGINNEFVPFGNFIIQKPDNEEVKEKTEFIGYDYMIKFNAEYKDRVIYPIKMKELFIDICRQVGLEAGNTNFVNADYMIIGNPFTNNEDCRTVLSNIAQLAGGFAKIGRDNKVYIVSLDTQGDAIDTLDGNNYYTDFSKNAQYGEINSLVIKVFDIEGENTSRDDKESIEENGLTEIVIENNYFLINQSEREKVIEPIWEHIKGLKYIPFKTQYYGYPYLDSGDAINILDSKDKKYLSYVFNHTFRYTGTFDGNIETLAMTKAQTAYKNTTDVKTKFKQAERRIDKINGIIEDIIEEQTDYEYKLTQVTQDIESIKQNVGDIIDYKREVEGVTEIHLTESANSNILKLEIQGNKTYESNLFPSENLFPSNDIYPNMEGSELL